MIKKLLIAVVVLVVLLMVAVGGVVYFAGSLAKSGIEKGGTYALGVPTRVDGVSLGLLSGRFSLTGLSVGSPAGYSAPHFLALGEGGVKVSLASLTSDVIEVPQFRLEDIDVRLQRKDGKGNYNVILDNIQKVSGPKGAEPKPSSSGSDKKLVINELTIRNVKVHLELLDAPGGIGKVEVPIDEIALKNVGKTGTGVGGTGVTISELAGIVVQALMNAAVERGGGLIPADVLSDLQGSLAKLDDLKGLGMQVIGDAKGTVENVKAEAQKAVEDIKKTGDDLKKGLEDAKKGIGDLIPKKKN
ncbi:MAG: AsmA family protein [Phycisphaeraceae bacterium]|nr:AsmA family protein [Phycisphaeraceae bacterium]